MEKKEGKKATSSARRRRLHWPIALVVVAYLLSFVWMPKSGFWINDNGLKFIQVQALVNSGFETSSIDLPGRAIDPRYEFGPVTGGFYTRVEGRLYAPYSLVFAALSAPPYILFGFPGLYILPLLGSFLALPAVRRLAAMLAGKRTSSDRAEALAVLAVGLATPVWFYGMTFWEHTPAVGLSCWAVLACMRFRAASTPRGALVTGCLAALPIYFRSDAYLFAAVLLFFAWMAARNRPRDAALLGGAFCLALLPLWIFHWRMLGHPLGHHVQSQLWGELTLTDYLAQRGPAARNLLLNTHGKPWWSAAAAAPFFVCFMLGPRLWGERRLRAVPIAAACALVAGVAVFHGQLSAAHPMNWLSFSNGLFSVCPLAIFAFLPPVGAEREGAESEAIRTRRALIAFLLAYVGLYAAFIPERNSAGIHWGCRFLLPAYPILAALAAVVANRWWEARDRGKRLQVVVVGSVLALSVFMQLYSLALLHERKRFSAELNDRVAASQADIVISDIWFLPVDLARCFFAKPLFQAREAKRPKLIAQATRAGARSALLVERLRPRPRAPVDSVLRDGWLHFSPVSLRTIALGTARDSPD